MAKSVSAQEDLPEKHKFQEKKKVQDALMLQKKEEAKQSKMIK